MRLDLFMMMMIALALDCIGCTLNQLVPCRKALGQPSRYDVEPITRYVYMNLPEKEIALE